MKENFKDKYILVSSSLSELVARKVAKYDLINGNMIFQNVCEISKS